MDKKLILTSASMFGLGVAVGWAITADYQEIKGKRQRSTLRDMMGRQAKMIYGLQMQLAEVTEANSTILADDIVPLPASEPLPEADVPLPFEIEVEDSDEYVVPEGETEEETRANLQNLINMYTDNQEVVEVFVRKAEPSTKVDYTPPFVISQEVYAWDEEGENYGKITLTYHSKERVLLDDEYDPIDDVNATVGWRALSQFGFESADPSVVFVRNRRLLTDFEVVRDDENPLPLHIKYGMSREEFNTHRAAGLIKPDRRYGD